MPNFWLVRARTASRLQRLTRGTAISAQSDRTTRREALFKCRDTGIDFVQVAVRVVELILAETLEVG
jgi:hypothetical protein